MKNNYYICKLQMVFKFEDMGEFQPCKFIRFGAREMKSLCSRIERRDRATFTFRVEHGRGVCPQMLYWKSQTAALSLHV
jgi:hypothetical protein